MMRRPAPSLSVALPRLLAAGTLLVGVAAAQAQLSPIVGAAGVYVGPPGSGARWVGGPYRPWIRPGWGYGYPRYGWGHGYGWGLGLGYGAGWALAAAPAWGYGWPAPAYVAPSWVPAVSAPVVEQVVVEERQPAVPQAATQQPGYWYYCTEPAGYYPSVNTCSRPWIAVNPTTR